MATTAQTSSTPRTAGGGAHRNAEDAAHAKQVEDSGFRCPDPSAHQHQAHNNALQNQASAAALKSTGTTRSGQGSGINPLGADGKLSSASAATSLKYAKATDLPSFPVVGIDTKTSAGAAALLANKNKKSPEYPRPESSSAAGKAALLAHDYKMAPLWQPEASAAGSKAALLAAKKGSDLNLWQPEASADGNSAANIAMRKQGLGPGAVDYGYTDQGRKNAFTAATGAHANSGRKRAQSNPAPPPEYPDSKNSARNALSAATLAHSPSMKGRAPTDSNRLGSGAMEAARIQHAKSVSRNMYTSAPPVSLEVEEKKRQDALRASAIVMAKKMYENQQQQPDGASAARTGATAAHGQRPATGEEDIKQQAMRYVGIQEAAQKLAQERLAKIGYDENAAYRSHYGYEKPRSRFSIRGRRQRSLSASETPAADDSDSDEDDFRSRRIRSQMEQFNKSLADVDAKKRENDRKMLLAAAERKVQAQMQGMDKSIYDKTGKMSPAMIEQWDEKARQKATANSEARMENHGKVHIGNGKWMEQSEIDAIAQSRIQPTLDEITEKTEKRRAEDEKRRAEEEERRLDEAERKRRERAEKERAAEVKAEVKKVQDEEKRATKLRNAEEKAAVKQEKETAKQEKETEKAKRAEEDRLAKEEGRKSREAARDTPAWAAVTVPADNRDLYKEPSAPGQTQTQTQTQTQAPTGKDPEVTSPTSPNSKGIKSMFSKLKRRSKNQSAGTIDMSSMKRDNKEAESGFVGGAALTGASSKSHSAISPTTATSDERPHNLGDVEPVPATTEHETANVHGDRYSDVSSLSSDEDVEPPRGRSTDRITSMTTANTGHSGNSEFEEARDHFDQDLAPPPTFTSDADKAAHKGSPTRDSKFKEIGI